LGIVTINEIAERNVVTIGISPMKKLLTIYTAMLVFFLMFDTAQANRMILEIDPNRLTLIESSLEINRLGEFSVTIDPNLFQKEVLNIIRLFGTNISPVGYGTNPPNFKMNRISLTATLSDEDLLDETEALAARFFYEQALSNGLVQDTQHTPYSSIAATGFGLTAFAIMAERYESNANWVYSPSQLRDRTSLILDTLIDIQAKQANNEALYGTHGLFHHFINADGTAASGSEVSTVDTALLFAGIITVGEYFGGEIKLKAERILGNADWNFFLRTPSNPFQSNNSIDYQFSHGWKPGEGIIKQTWDRPTDETIIVSVIALASDPNTIDFQKSLFSWPRVKRSYGEYDVVNSYFGSLFTYEFAHAWIDFERLGKDKPQGIMTDVNGVDWWDNSIQAARAARQFAMDHSHIYSSYGPDSWGLSAVYKPNGAYEGEYGALPSERLPVKHDGTIAPYSSISTIVFFMDEDNGILADNLGFRTLRHYHDTYHDQLWGPYGPRDSFNHRDEFSALYLGIDQGIIVAMIENYRTRFVWQQFMKYEPIRTALKQVFEFVEYEAGGAIYTDPSNPLTTGLDDVTIFINGSNGSFQTVTASALAGLSGLWRISLPEGTYLVSSQKQGYGFKRISGGVVGDWVPITIEVNQANIAANQSIQFLAERSVLHDWNGDGIVSIIGDVPPFVNCVYFQSCPDAPDDAILRRRPLPGGAPVI